MKRIKIRTETAHEIFKIKIYSLARELLKIIYKYPCNFNSDVSSINNPLFTFLDRVESEGELSAGQINKNKTSRAEDALRAGAKRVRSF